MKSPQKIEPHLTAIEQLAHYKAWQLVKSKRISRDDEDDIAQELLMHVFMNWPRLASTDFTPIGFARLIIQQKTCDVLRRKSRRKDKFWSSMNSTEVDVGGVETIGSHDPAFRHKEQAEVVGGLLNALAPRDRVIAQALMHHDLKHARKHLGLSKRQMTHRLSRIRQCYRELNRQD